MEKWKNGKMENIAQRLDEQFARQSHPKQQQQQYKLQKQSKVQTEHQIYQATNEAINANRMEQQLRGNRESFDQIRILLPITHRFRIINAKGQDIRDNYQYETERLNKEYQYDNKPSDSTDIDSARPDSARPDSARLDSARLDSARLDSARLDSARLDSARPDSVRPDSARLDSTYIDSATPIEPENFYRVKSAQKSSSQDIMTHPSFVGERTAVYSILQALH